MPKKRDEYLIKIPFPPPALNPNSRCHYLKKANSVKRLRGITAELAIQELGKRKPTKWKHALCQSIFYCPDRRRRDRDNGLASLKAAFDGITDSGIIDDDCGLIHLPCFFDHDKHAPRVEIKLIHINPKSRVSFLALMRRFSWGELTL